MAPSARTSRTRTPKRRLPRRPPRRALLRRWAAVLALAFVAYLYYHPATSYLATRATVAVRAAEVQRLEREHEALERRLRAQTSDAALVREARRLGYVQPGERLFIVKGIPEWRRSRGDRSTLGGGG